MVDARPAGAARWIGNHRDLLIGLRALRQLGPLAADAVEAVIELPSVERVRMSWELAVALAEAEGRDGREAMVDLLGADDAALIEAALFEVPPRLVCLDGGAE